VSEWGSEVRPFLDMRSFLDMLSILGFAFILGYEFTFLEMRARSNEQ
jgi:hypothetical protein